MGKFLGMLRLFQYVAVVTVLFAPKSGFAQDLGWYNNVVLGIGDLVALAVPILLGIAVAVFVWGLLQYFWQGDDETVRGESRAHMVWAVLALFVIVTVWGLVALLMELTGVQDGETVEAPNADFGDGGFGNGGGGGGGGGGGTPGWDFPAPPPAI